MSTPYMGDSLHDQTSSQEDSSHRDLFPSQTSTQPSDFDSSLDSGLDSNVASQDYFYEAFRTTPSPQPHRSFLDGILNPIEQRQSVFGYQVLDNSPPRRQHSPSVLIPSSMPASRNRIQRPSRLPNGYVDLTGSSDSSNAPRRPGRSSPSPGPSAKRRKQDDGTHSVVELDKPTATIEEIDLSDDKQATQNVLQKQREEAVKAQQKPEETTTTFNTFTCVICMDMPTDLTATACGHLFCHTCLMEALIAGENRAGPGEPKRSQCPVCRKVLNRSKATDIIPLLLKKGLATQPRKSSIAAATAKGHGARKAPRKASTRRSARLRGESAGMVGALSSVREEI